MAGDWIKVEMTTHDKPEVVQMAARLRIDQDAITGKLLRIWAWADQNFIAGDTVGVTENFIDRLTNKRGFAAAMRDVGWLGGEDGMLVFPNFERHNGKSAKARAMDCRKKTAKRLADKCPENVPAGSGQTRDENGDQRREEKRREELKDLKDPLRKSAINLSATDREISERLEKELGAVEFQKAITWAKSRGIKGVFSYIDKTLAKLSVSENEPWNRKAAVHRSVAGNNPLAKSRAEREAEILAELESDGPSATELRRQAELMKEFEGEA